VIHWLACYSGGVGTIEKAQSVAVVDDDVSARRAIHGVLKSVGFAAETFASGEEFLAADELNRSACLITDVQMPGMSGLELQERLVEKGRSIPVIFVTAYGDDKARSRAMSAGAVAFLEKPFNDDALIAIVKTAIEG
jgi:FixJ family two-component response regulator